MNISIVKYLQGRKAAEINQHILKGMKIIFIENINSWSISQLYFTGFEAF